VSGLVEHDDGSVGCWWTGGDADYRAYHDEEWGMPVADDHRLFEKICLEGFQSGLSWLTILRKRDNFRHAFRDFDPARVARFTSRSVDRLLGDAGIVRHRGKIEATIANARRVPELVDEFGSLAAFFWSFAPPPGERPEAVTYDALVQMTETPSSRALSAELKRRGWRFVGPTTCYAFMQAMGMVNDHLEGCVARERCEEMRAALVRPGKKP
jgi:DNA-3-methyladenine glycosylase I